MSKIPNVGPVTRAITRPNSKPKASQSVLRALLRRKVVVVAIVVLAIIVVTAAFAPLLAPYDPNEQDPAASLQGASAAHWLGTDLLGRDVLSRIIFGARISLLVGAAVVVLAGLLGVTIGIISGYVGGVVDAAFMRAIDALMAIPVVIFGLALGAALGGGIGNVILALGIGTLPVFARVMRGQVLGVREMDYIKAGTVLGIGPFRNMLVHVLPNCISPIIVLMTMNIGAAILTESGLSFLGLGVAPPMASWGSMVSDGYRFITMQPLISFAPGIAIVVTVLAFNILGDALRDVLDPRLKGVLR